jgi:2-polyprenyl-3-methyl-5-hydroxy-6-metoxy-1,4-benzoquinol methylase
MAGELLEHIEKPEMLIKEMARICKVGGYLAIHTPFKETEWNKNVVIPQEHMWEFGRDDMIKLFSPYGEPELKFLIHQRGIHIIAITKLCQR